MRLKADQETQLLWTATGINVALEVSTSSYDLECRLVGSAITFWSSSSNCFFFPWGHMSITLLDVFTIAGFELVGQAVEDILTLPTPFIPEDALAYSNFLSRFYHASGLVTQDERLLFLLFWLSKYVFFSLTLKICKDYLQIAASLATGNRLALAPLVLVALYRGFTHASWAMKFGDSGTISGVFWILQAWMALYFPSFFGRSDRHLSHLSL